MRASSGQIGWAKPTCAATPWPKKVLARKFSSDGRILWPAPWRARNATRLPRSVPSRYGPDGSPNGVFSTLSSRSVSSAMSYNPLPPITPTWTDISLLVRLKPDTTLKLDYVLRARSPRSGTGSRASRHRLHVLPAVFLANIPRRDLWIVFEHNEVF